MTESEARMERYQALMQNIRDGIHVMDDRGDVIEVNDAFCEMLGYTRDEAKKLNIADWNAQYSKEELLARLSSFAGKSARFETVHRRKDGTYINVEVSTSGIDIDGQTFIFASSRDITERKLEEENLLITQFVSDHAPDSIFWIDEQARIVYVNESAYQERGFTKDELLGKFITDVDLGSRIDRWPDHWLKLRQQGSLTFISRHQRKDGSTFPIEVSANFVKFEDRELNVSFCRDITERKKSEDLLKRHALVINNTHEGFWLVDQQGKLLEANQAYADMSGYPVEELVNMHITQLDAVEGRQVVQERIKRILAQGHDLFETKHRHKNGHLFDVESRSVIGRASAVLCFFQGYHRAQGHRVQNKDEPGATGNTERIAGDEHGGPATGGNAGELPGPPAGGILTGDAAQGRDPCDGRKRTAPEAVGFPRLSAQIQSLCARVPLGLCHCGRAAASGEMQYAQCVDDRHEITYSGIQDHGHYSMPLISNNEILGVLVLYLPVNFQREPLKEQFIASGADVLAGLISRKNAEHALLMHQTHLEGSWQHAPPTCRKPRKRPRSPIGQIDLPFQNEP